MWRKNDYSKVYFYYVYVRIDKFDCNNEKGMRIVC